MDKREKATKSRYLGRGINAFEQIEKHFFLSKKFGYKYETTITTKYSLFRQLLDGIDFETDEIDDIPEKSSKFDLKATWRDGPNFKYYSRPTSQVNVECSFVPGWNDSKLGFLELADDVANIISFCDWIEKGETQWIETERDDNVINSLMDYIESFQTTQYKSNDFSLDLWMILRNCKSHLTLKESLEFFIDCIKKRQVNAFVAKDNKSTLAKIMRSSPDDIPAYFLEPISCTNMLLEIGFYYLKTQLFYLFTSQNLLPSLTDVEALFEDGNFIKSTRKILPLFLALQTVFTVKKYISVDTDNLIQFTKSTIRHFINATDPFTEEYKFAFKAVYFNDVCFTDCFLTEWKVKILFTNPHTNQIRLEVDIRFNENIKETEKYCNVSKSSGDTNNDIKMDTKELSRLNTATMTNFDEVILSEEERQYVAKNVFYCSSVLTSYLE